MEGVLSLEKLLLPNDGIAGFRFAAYDAAAAAEDKKPGGADRTVDVKPPPSESRLISSFDKLIFSHKSLIYMPVSIIIRVNKSLQS